MEAIKEDIQQHRRAAAITAEAIDAVTNATIHRSPGMFAGTVDEAMLHIAERRGTGGTEGFDNGRGAATHVVEVGFHNGRTAALRARPGEDPGAETIEGAAHEAEMNARQYSGHVPGVIQGRASGENLWDCYERSVSAGIRSVRRTPFGDNGPTAYDTPDGGFSIDAYLAERLQIEPRSGGHRAYDAAVPAGFVESVRELALSDTHVASHFVYSYAHGAMGVPFPYTVMGVELLRAHNAKFGTRWEEPDRVANLMRV
jgi:hypothetical protein